MAELFYGLHQIVQLVFIKWTLKVHFTSKVFKLQVMSAVQVIITIVLICLSAPYNRSPVLPHRPLSLSQPGPQFS